jgi:nucleotidyltransferase/DNA polymerase involved in DNA repair
MTRQLKDLSGVGPAMLRDFEVLGIRTVADLADREPNELYETLCQLTGSRHDICVLDAFECTIAQARNPDLPPHERQWWWWSRRRKAGRG